MKLIAMITCFFPTISLLCVMAGEEPQGKNQVEGFAKLISASNNAQYATYRSSEESDKAMSHYESASSGNEAVEWETAVVPKEFEGKPVTFIVAYGLGASKGIYWHEFFMDGKKILDFTCESKEFSAKNDIVKLDFKLINNDINNDDFGLLYIRVQPEALAYGKPVKFKVAGKKELSESWFMISDFNDNLEYLKKYPFGKNRNPGKGNLLTDTGFSKESGWISYVNTPAAEAGGSVTLRDGKAVVKSPAIETQSFNNIQLIKPVDTEADKSYKLKFNANAEKAGYLTISYCLLNAPYTGYANANIYLAPGQKEYECMLAVKKDKDGNYGAPRSLRLFFGAFKDATVTVSDVSFMVGKAPVDNGPVITTILGSGLNKEYFNPTDAQIETAARELAEAGFTMSWDAAPVTWGKQFLLNEPDYFTHYQKIAAAMRRHGIGIAFGFHWHRLLPAPVKDFPNMYGEQLDPKTGNFVKDNWNFGSAAALQEFAKNAKTLFEKVGQFEMFYADEVVFGSAGDKAAIKKISTYWTSQTYSIEALTSFRAFLAAKNFPDAANARFPVTTVVVEPGTKANMGLPSIPITEINNDRLVADNNWPDGKLWCYWYEWRTQLYCNWLDTITTLAWDANKDNKNWMGCYYEMPIFWMVTGLGQDIEKIAKLPHVDYIVAGYRSGEQYAFVKNIAEASGKKWGLQVEVSRYEKSEGMSPAYIEKTFKNAVNDGASIITCYAGMSFRSGMISVPENYRKHGWYYMPDQVKAWDSCIEWLKKGGGLKRPNFTNGID